MSFRDSVQADINGVFMNQSEFAETHIWGDRPILCASWTTASSETRPGQCDWMSL